MYIKHEKRLEGQRHICMLSHEPVMGFECGDGFINVPMRPQLEDRLQQVELEERLAKSISAWAEQRFDFEHMYMTTVVAGDYWGQILTISPLGKLAKEPEYRIANIWLLGLGLLSIALTGGTGMYLFYMAVAWWGWIPALYSGFFWSWLTFVAYYLAATWRPRWEKCRGPRGGVRNPAVDRYGTNGYLERVVSPYAG